MDKREIPIPEPCPARWESMQGDDARRFCSSCNKHVHNLSALSEDAARSLLASKKGSGLCVQYASAPDGRVLFAAELLARRRPRRPLLAGVAGSLLAACAVPADGADAGAHALDGGLEADAAESFEGMGAGDPRDVEGAPRWAPGMDEALVMGGDVADVATALAIEAPSAKPSDCNAEPAAPPHTDADTLTEPDDEPRYTRGRPALILGEISIDKPIKPVFETHTLGLLLEEVE